MFPLDSDSRGSRFYNLTASVVNDRIHLRGLYRGDLLPVLLFSVGVPWVEPCTRHVCCLWDVAERYKDRDLLDALGGSCNERANLTTMDLMKGSHLPGSWDVDTMIHPSFVAMLFLCLAPSFYMQYEILPIQWADAGTTHWSAAWYGQACHTVRYPDGRDVCISCGNAKPDNAVFVFSPDWFTTFRCPWVCKPGFAGPNCELGLDMVIYAASSAVGTLMLGGMLVCVLRRRRAERPPELPTPIVAKPPPARNDAIAFKDNVLPDIRIKLL